MGVRKDGIKQLWPHVGVSLPVHQSVHGAGTGVTACDMGVMATKRLRCLVLVAMSLLCITQDNAMPPVWASR